MANDAYKYRFYNFDLQEKILNKQSKAFEMEEQCPICFWNYDEIYKCPISMCQEQHFCCRPCLNQIIANKAVDHDIHCIYCRRKIDTKSLQTDLLYPQFDRQIQRQKQQYNHQIIHYQQQFHSGLLELIGSSPNDEETTSYLKNQALSLMRSQSYEAAISYIKLMIEQNFEEADREAFVGLGLIEEAVGFCENADLDWYESRYGQICALDLLALCYMNCPNYADSKDWYERRLMRFPNSHKLHYGLAVAATNTSHLKHASFMATRAIELCPQFAKGYLLLAFIYREISDYERMKTYIEKCLQLEPNNFHAIFLLTAYEDSTKRRETYLIKNVRKILQIEPKYQRALQRVPPQFRKWSVFLQKYKRSYKGAPIHFILPALHFQQLDAHERSLFMGQFIERKDIWEVARYGCYFHMAHMHISEGNYSDAKNYLAAAAEHSMYTITALIKIYDLLFQEQRYEQAMEYIFKVIKRFRGQYLQIASKQFMTELTEQLFSYFHICYKRTKDDSVQKKWFAIILTTFPRQNYCDFLSAYRYFSFYLQQQSLKNFKICIQKEYRLSESLPYAIILLQSTQRFEQMDQYIDQFLAKCNPPAQLQEQYISMKRKNPTSTLTDPQKI